jgi:cytochrome P450 family 4
MFEGHDTTSAAVSWCLFLLGSNQTIQSKVLHEIDTIMCGDRERAPTMKELGEMKYLECCIKEALRLYPSVPLIARHLKEDVKIGKRIFFHYNEFK